MSSCEIVHVNLFHYKCRWSYYQRVWFDMLIWSILYLQKPKKSKKGEDEEEDEDEPMEEDQKEGGEPADTDEKMEDKEEDTATADAKKLAELVSGKWVG